MLLSLCVSMFISTIIMVENLVSYSCIRSNMGLCLTFVHQLHDSLDS